MGARDSERERRQGQSWTADRRVSDQVERGDDQLHSGSRPDGVSGSGWGHGGPSAGHDDRRPPVEHSDQPSTHRSRVGSESASDSGHRHRRSLDSVDVPTGTDPRFDADVDRTVQRLYRELERKIRIERERRGL
ncbi:hypothetical protein [Natrinema sp. 74]|uniref:hypothetical protein n=1 Tax=Natrinema sp. 74 TaxID=3384159 RepID=UPI0038D4EDD2